MKINQDRIEIYLEDGQEVVIHTAVLHNKPQEEGFTFQTTIIKRRTGKKIQILLCGKKNDFEVIKEEEAKYGSRTAQ